MLIGVLVINPKDQNILQQMDKQVVIHSDNGILFSIKWNELLIHTTAWINLKSALLDTRPKDPTHMTYLKLRNCMVRNRNRWVAAGAWREGLQPSESELGGKAPVPQQGPQAWCFCGLHGTDTAECVSLPANLKQQTEPTRLLGDPRMECRSW